MRDVDNAGDVIYVWVCKKSMYLKYIYIYYIYVIYNIYIYIHTYM